jgi:hypothetical protein
MRGWFREWRKAREARRWLRDWWHDEGYLTIRGCPHCEDDE